MNILNKIAYFVTVLMILAACTVSPTSAPKKVTMNTPAVYTAELLLDAKAKLGEGALWDAEKAVLYWVDIEGKKLHLYDPATQQDRAIDVGQRVGTVVPVAENEAVVALQDGVYRLDLSAEKLELIANPLAGIPNIRLNDGKCDPAGRLWVGSMELQGKAKAAALYRMEPDGQFERVVDSVTVSNGIVWSLDKTKMYYIDTPTKKVMGYDYDLATGRISNPRVAVQIPDGIGFPDGMTIDSEGMVWIGMWNGFAVTRWNPETGAYLGKVQVPAQNVTACAFGGKNLDILYITTASIATSADTLAKYPHCGGLFSVKTGHKGVKAFSFGKP